MKGVTAYLSEENDNKINLILNDVVATSNDKNPDWKHDVHFTSNGYDFNALKELSLTEQQYADIGKNLVIRLLVLSGSIK